MLLLTALALLFSPPVAAISSDCGAPEVADGVDQDCDGAVDEGTDAFDDDGDGWTEDGGDCDDARASVSPAGAESCDGVDQDCDDIIDETTSCFDDDNDGWTEEEGDCNDGNPSMRPDAPEIEENSIDDDCDGVVDDGIFDEDGDGWTESSGDCYDRDPDSWPGAPEKADGWDNDCDDLVDEETDDYDDDGDGWAEEDGDCDDGSDAVHPGAAESGDGRDEDCDGEVDEGTDYSDDDGDGFSEQGGDCADGDAAINPAAEEVVDGEDNDCDGLKDEGLVDADGDGWTVDDGDCDDAEGWINPGLFEMCDALDNDCDRAVDEDCAKDAAGGCGCAPGVSPGAPSLPGGLALLLAGGLVAGRRRSRWGLLALLGVAGCTQDSGFARLRTVLEAEPLVDGGVFPLGVPGVVEIPLTAPKGGVQVLGVEIEHPDGGGPWFSYSGDWLIVGDGEEVMLPLDYAPADEGYHYAQVTVLSDADDGDLTLIVRARAAAAVLRAWPAVLEYGERAEGEQATLPLSLANESPFDLTLSADLPGLVSGASFPESLAEGEQVEVDVTISAPAGAEVSQLLLEAPELTSPVTITLRVSDCEGGLPEAYDLDGDGWTTCADSGAPWDCDDDDPAIHPAREEAADGVDQDCDGTIDEGTAAFDDDEDGFTEDEGDCDDSEAGISPDAEEAPDGVDGDCDGTVDEGTTRADDDGDGFTEDGGDCDDADASRYPGSGCP